MANFYSPIITPIENLPIIIYPCIGVEKVFDRKKPNSIENHIEKLYRENRDIVKEVGQYHIIILWNDINVIMTDIWIFGELESWEAGPIVDVKTFRNLTLDISHGVTAGDGLVVLGREEEYRRKSATLDEFIYGKRPHLPTDIAPKEEFYEKS